MARITLAGVIVALAALVATLGASASFPGENGRIAFQTNRDGNAEVYSMNANGTDRVNLTRHSALDTDPAWSRDGTRIAFVSNRDGNNEVFAMKADRSDVTQLTFTDGEIHRAPSWTNDDRILFQRGTLPDRDIYRIDPDGTDLTKLTDGPYDSAWAAGAPRGPLIAFARFSPEDGQHIFTLNTVSGVTKRVTPSSLDEFEVLPSWSPTGNDLVFVRFDTDGAELFKVHKDGTALTQVTNTPDRAESSPSFSPDGAKIVFSACTNPPEQRCGNYVLNADGTGEEDVSTPRIPYLDTFTGDWIDPFWHRVLFGTGSSLTQVDGRLVESFTADAQQGGPFDNINAHVGANCKLVGDFDVRVDYELLTWPDANGVQVALNAFEPEAQVLRESQAWGNYHSTWISPTFTDEPTADLAGSLRITRVGTTISGYYLDGSDWVSIASGTRTLADATVGLASSSFLNRFGHEAVDVAFDNFEITSGEFACPWWWADVTPDWQPVARG